MQKNSSLLDVHTDQALRPIGYARVSREDQNLALQLDALTRAGVPLDNIYQETISGAKEKRPEFDRMMRELRAGDVLTIWKLDRLSRSLRAMLETVDEIKARGAYLRILTEYVDTSTAAGRMFLNMLGVIANFERELGLERTYAGLAIARAEGRVGGRRPLYTDEQIRRAMWHMEHEGWDWGRAAGYVKTTAKAGGHAISIANLQKRVRKLREQGIQGMQDDEQDAA